MKLKTLLLTVGVLGLLSLAVYFLNQPKNRQAGADARIGTTLLAAAAAEGATQVELTDNGKTVTLKKTASGTWIVPDYHELPVEFSRLSGLIGKLAETKIERLVTQNPQRLSQMGFTDAGVKLIDTQGKVVTHLLLGKTAEGGGRFIRFGDEQKAYLARLDSYLDTEAKSWADAALLSFKPETVASVEWVDTATGSATVFSRANATAEFTADKVPEGQRVAGEKLTTLLNTLTALRFTETSAVDDPNAVAARQHLQTVTLKTFDNQSVRVSWGRKPEQKIIKAPEPKKDGTTGPTALGTFADLAKAETKAGDSAKEGEKHAPGSPDSGPAKVVEPAVETLPAGPMYAFVTHSDPSATINTSMNRRAFQISEWSVSSLPKTPSELFVPGK